MEKGNEITYSYIKIFLRFLLGSVLLGFYMPASAATLQVSPSSGAHFVGDTFSIDVIVSSSDQAMNTVAGVLTFPQNILQVESLSKANSIVSLWIPPGPTSSGNSITFEGIVLNPGFTGPAGNIISVTFNAISAGTAEVSFSSGSVLANDGEGTSILEGLQSGSFDITTIPEDDDDEEDDNEDDDPTDPGDDDPGDDPGDTTDPGGSISFLPSPPDISSLTHPDPDLWYSNSTAQFTWPISGYVQEVRLSISGEPEETPMIAYSPIDSKEITGIEDGTWYLHAQLKNVNGWGEASHFRFQIDTQGPSYFRMKRITPEDGLVSAYSEFLFEASDNTSGVDHYEVAIDNQDPIVWKDDGTHIFKVSRLIPGEHTFVVRIVDEAGNFLVYSKVLYIDPLDISNIKQYLDRPTDDRPIDVWKIGGPITSKITPIVSYSGIGIGIGQAMIFAGNATSLVDIWFILLRFLSFLGSFFRRRKSEPWGVVYDSVTKQPLDPAYVSIRAVGKQKDAAITDLEGRYGFLVPYGRYLIEANKTHYSFPSERLWGKAKDELYNDLYFGGPVEINEKNKGVIRYNIPLDPVGFDWNEYAKKQKGLVKGGSKRRYIVRFVSNLIFFSGFVFSTYLLWIQPILINFGLFVLYAAVFIFQEFWKTSHPVTKLLDVNSNKPISFAIIKAYVAGNDILLKTIVTNEKGQFYMLTPPGEYYLTVEVKKADGSYTPPYRTKPVKLKKGVVLKNLYVKKDKEE